MSHLALRFAFTCYAIMLSITGVYSKNIMLIDCSGSIAGQSANRSENSLSVIVEELDSYLRKYQFQNDTIVLQCFTDKLLGKYEIVKYDDKAVEFIKSLGYPRRGNSDIATALYAAYKETENNPSDKIVLITDGLHNNGMPEKELLYKLSEMADKSPDKIFMLLLSEKDIHSGLGQTFDRQQGLHLIRSLSELAKFNAAGIQPQSELETDEENVPTSNTIYTNKENDMKSEFTWRCILYVLLIILLLVLIGVVVYYCRPLFAQSGAAQSSVKELMKQNMPLYNQNSRGIVKAITPEQQKLSNQIMIWEHILYTKLSVPEKYAILEKIRLELDRLYLEDRETYDKYHRQLKPNTWDALEDAWKLWDPVPKSNGVWSGPGDRTCSLKSSSPYYADCADKGFLQAIAAAATLLNTVHGKRIIKVRDIYDRTGERHRAKIRTAVFVIFALQESLVRTVGIVRARRFQRTSSVAGPAPSAIAFGHRIPEFPRIFQRVPGIRLQLPMIPVVCLPVLAIQSVQLKPHPFQDVIFLCDVQSAVKF